MNIVEYVIIAIALISSWVGPLMERNYTARPLGDYKVLDIVAVVSAFLAVMVIIIELR